MIINSLRTACESEGIELNLRWWQGKIIPFVLLTVWGNEDLRTWSCWKEELENLDKIENNCLTFWRQTKSRQDLEECWNLHKEASVFCGFPPKSVTWRWIHRKQMIWTTEKNKAKTNRASQLYGTISKGLTCKRKDGGEKEKRTEKSISRNNSQKFLTG